MSGSSTSWRRARLVLAHAIVVAAPAVAGAAIGFGTGSATWSWDADTNSTLGGKTTFSIAPPNSSAIPVPSNYQLSRTGTSGGTSGTGKGSIGYTVNATTATFKLSGGSGAAQVDPTDAFTGDTITKVVFSGNFPVTGSSFAGTGYLSLTVGGTAGVGGYAKVAGDMTFKLNSAGGSNLRTPISFFDQFNGGASPTPYSKTYTYSSPLNVSVPVGQSVFVSGSFTFFASNAGGPSDIVPLNIEAGGAPLITQTFYGGTTSNWNDAASWTPPNDPLNNITFFTEAGAPTPAAPNGAGQRARIVDVGGSGPRTINLDTPVTLGSMLIDDNDGLVLNNQSFFFDNGTDPSTISVQSSGGNGGVDFNQLIGTSGSLIVEVQASDSLLETTDTVNFNDGVGATTEIRFTGRGTSSLNAINTFGAVVVENDAKLNANAPGSLSNSPVLVNGARLNLNNAGAQQNTTVGIDVNSSGQLDLGTDPLGMRLRLNGESVISGDSAELGALNVGVNLLSQPGTIIGHETFDTGPTGNPIGLGNTPQFTFGFSQSLILPGGSNFTFGTGAVGTPWSGIGGDRSLRQISGDTSVIVSGTGTIASAANGFVLALSLDGGPTAVAIISGKGAVRLESPTNGFSGTINVRPDAKLRVNGNLPNVQSITVGNGGLLGGTGQIGGAVVVQNGGILDPGAGREFGDVTGVLTTGPLTLSPNSILAFDFGGDPMTSAPNDQLQVNGDLVLDGQILIEQLQFFSAAVGDIVPIISWTGTLTNNGLVVSPQSQDILDMPATSLGFLVVDNGPGLGGSVFLAIPEPSTVSAAVAATCLFARRRRR